MLMLNPIYYDLLNPIVCMVTAGILLSMLNV